MTNIEDPRVREVVEAAMEWRVCFASEIYGSGAGADLLRAVDALEHAVEADIGAVLRDWPESWPCDTEDMRRRMVLCRALHTIERLRAELARAKGGGA